MKKYYLVICLFLASMIFYFSPELLNADECTRMSKGQVVYVPAYPHVYVGTREMPFFLSVTLNIRNIDFEHKINITKVSYFESQDALEKKMLDIPFSLDPLRSVRYNVPEKHEKAGVGAYFLVYWDSKETVNPPVIETIMIGTRSQQGISFTANGKVVNLNK